MKLKHKKFTIYTEGGKPAKIVDPKEAKLLINDEPNGANLHDVCKEIEDIDTGEITAWSVLHFYTPQDGYLVDSEGNRISLLNGDEKVFFKSIENAFIPEWDKEVSLDYVKMMASLLNIGNIEETITALSNEDKQIVVEERMAANEKRQKQIQKEKAEADAKEKQKLEAERIENERKQKEDQERLEALQKEEEEKAAIEAEEKRKQKEIEEEEKRKEKEAKEAQEKQERIEAEIKRKRKERAENPNVYSPAQFRDLRKGLLEDGTYTEYITDDGKYIFFFPETISKDAEPFITVRTEEDFEELEGGELTINNEKIAEYEFKDNGKDKAVTLDKRKDSIRVQVLA